MTQRQDQLSIETPELVSLEFPIAGIGSRALAVILDYLLQGIVFTFAAFFTVLLLGHHSFGDKGSGLWAVALFILVPFLLHWFYFAIFEAFWHGQTPGKWLIKLRVIEQSGRSVTLFESATRNFLRVVDILPLFYAVGGITMLISRRQQRLGDLAAGTLVVHERPVEEPLGSSRGTRTFTFAVNQQLVQATPVVRSNIVASDTIARLSMQDLLAIESFLARRLDLPLAARETLAEKLSQRMLTQMQIDMPGGVSTETFLEQLAALRRDSNFA